MGRVDALSGGLACTAHSHFSPFFPKRSQCWSPLHAFDVRVISISLGGGWALVSGGPSLGGVSVRVLSCELCCESSLGGGPGLDASPIRMLAKACMLWWAAVGGWGWEGLTLVSPAACLFALHLRPWVGSYLACSISEISISALSLVHDCLVDGPELIVIEARGHVWHVLRHPLQVLPGDVGAEVPRRIGVERGSRGAVRGCCCTGGCCFLWRAACSTSSSPLRGGFW